MQTLRQGLQYEGLLKISGRMKTEILAILIKLHYKILRPVTSEKQGKSIRSSDWASLNTVYLYGNTVRKTGANNLNVADVTGQFLSS